MVPNCAGEDGSVTEAYRNFYLARALARVGYIVLGGVYVHENGKGFPRQLGIHSDAVKTGLSELAQALGKYSRVGVQLSFKSLQRLPEDFKESEIAVYRKAFTDAAVRAARFGLSPVRAIPAALKQAGLGLGDMDLIELNEAFAAQYLACERELKLDRTKVNVHGGAIALGHPVAATGTKLLTTLLYAMRQRDVTLGVVSLCIGGGNGVAAVVERLN